MAVIVRLLTLAVAFWINAAIQAETREFRHTTNLSKVIEARTKKMTVEGALAALNKRPNTPKDMPALLQKALSVKRSNKTQGAAHKAEARGHMRGGRVARQEPETDETGYESVGAAEGLLGQMIGAVETNLDVEIQECIMDYKALTGSIETSRQAIADEGAKSAGARARANKCQGIIDFCMGKIPTLDELLKALNDQCESEKVAAEAQLDLLAQDLEIMRGIINMSKCSEETQQPTLLQCCVHKTGKKSMYLDEKDHPIGKLQSDVAKTLLDKVFPNKASSRHARAKANRQQKPLALLQAASEQRLRVLHQDPVWVDMPEECPDKSRAKCSISDSANCPEIRERFMEIEAGIAQKEKDMQAELQKKQTYCGNERENLESQINQLSGQQTTEEANLAKEIAAMNEADDNAKDASDLMQTNLGIYKDRLLGCDVKYGTELHCEDEMPSDAGTCAEHVDSFLTELCGLKRLRIELMRIDGDQEDIFMSDVVDCEVSDWVEHACSKPCGLGERTKTRTIIKNAHHGADCPPLEMKEPCNPQSCPIDCRMDEWEEWSSCSVSCGGGTRERTRNILEHPQFEGNPCETPTLSSESCNDQSCNVDCVLGEWTEWCDCDKYCGGGRQKQIRNVLTPATGLGECWAPDDESKRIVWRDCNTAPCEEVFMLPPENPYLQCSEFVDILFVVDGSGQGGASGEKFAALKKLLATLINNTVLDSEEFEQPERDGMGEIEYSRTLSFLGIGGGHARVGVLVYGGPTNTVTFSECIGTSTDMAEGELDCGSEIVQHFTDDRSALEQSVEEATAPGGAPLLSLALRMAGAELAHSRRMTPSVVAVLTGSSPVNDEQAMQAANALKDKAKVVFVTTEEANQKLHVYHEMVGWLWPSHVVTALRLEELENPRVVNFVMETVCPWSHPWEMYYHMGM